jgi:imidazole glycerol-phosphate synthase subunit HisF
MLRPRILPCLLLRNSGLVKTKQFIEYKYIGDPINAVKIFNEKSVDELLIIDIDASCLGIEPDYRIIEKLANETRMPLCYGGGIKTISQAERIIQLGVEKVAISSAVLEEPFLIKHLSEIIGSQSVVCVLDVKKSIFKGYEIYINNGKKKIKGSLIQWIKTFQEYGAGEILINSIDRDGMQNGYDLALVELIKKYITIPVTFLGGASSLDDIGDLIENFGLVGCAAGSLFVFKGKYRAVLINYPSFNDKYELVQSSILKFKGNLRKNMTK